MLSAASVNDIELKAAFLQARDARQHLLGATLTSAQSTHKATVLFLGTNIPGPDKFRPGSTALIQHAMVSLQAAIGLEMLHADSDLLGPFRMAVAQASPEAVKAVAMAVETDLPAARLLDIDVYRSDGTQVDRAAVQAPARPCLLCVEPAGACIRLGRHAAIELREVVDQHLRPWVPGIPSTTPSKLALALVQGARQELQVTPKPGLVDGLDSGSHRDLTYINMEASAGLLSIYFDEILRSFSQQRPLQDFVQAGRDAEGRMVHAIQANAHKGYIFLSGLVLLALCECQGDLTRLRSTISQLATRFFTQFDPPGGNTVRHRQAVGGIQAEAQQGLPAIFECGVPRYLEALNAGWHREDAAFYLMAMLMQTVEDTTAIQRCGPEGLQRVKRDGRRLQHLLESRQCPKAWLSELNLDYQRLGLTMGGVADCMALTFALTAPRP